MRHHAPAAVLAAALAVSPDALAQDGVTIYGVLDTGIEHVSNANAQGGSLTRVPSITGTLPSRLGLRGREALGGGLNAIFTLESGYNLDTGTSNQGGRLFGRQAWVGLQGDFGAVTAGRVYSMLYWASLDADIPGPDIYGGVGSFDPYMPNARVDNALSYRGTFGGFGLGATYAFGRDAAGSGNSPGQGTCAGEAANNAQACRLWSALLRYDMAGAGMAAAYEQQHGGAGALASLFNGTTPLALTSAGDTDARATLNGYVKMAPFKAGAGWLGRRVRSAAAAVRTDQYYLTASWQSAGALTVDGGVYRAIDGDQHTSGTIVLLRGLYALSRGTTLHLQCGHLANGAGARYTLSQGGAGTTPNAGSAQTGVMLGLRHVF
jgi:predicted porin